MRCVCGRKSWTRDFPKKRVGNLEPRELAHMRAQKFVEKAGMNTGGCS